MKPESYTFSLCPAAALIRGNRNNCTQFSKNLDWLVSKLERLESSSGIPVITFKFSVRPVKQHILISFCQSHKYIQDIHSNL